MNFLKNYLSTSLFIIFFLFFYKINSYLSWNLYVTLDINILWENIKIEDFIFQFFKIYLILLIPYYIIEEWKSKALIIIEFIIKKIKNINYEINNIEKNAILAWIVKIFFWPLMLKYLINGINSIFSQINTIIWYYQNSQEVFFYDFLNSSIFPVIIWIIFFIDVLFFALWYLLEWKMFKNQIKSVEPTFFWWWVAIMCYEPFNQAIVNFIWWYHNTSVYFGSNVFTIIINLIIIILLSIYSRASFSLWLKASNLTNRWIITNGPYKFLRHPAYVCKNLAWWIAWLWIIYNNFINNNFINVFLIIFSLTIWSYIYYLRAITEENHLSLDKDYINYKKNVTNRFFPKFKK